MKRRMMQIVLGVLALGLIAGVGETARAGEPDASPVTIPAAWVKTEVYFGGNLPGGKKISPEAWADFMDNVLTPHFPKGLTVYEAYGQMQHADGRIEKQSTRVVVILHPQDSAIDEAIRKVTEAFREAFHKAQVVTVSTPVISAQFHAD